VPDGPGTPAPRNPDRKGSDAGPPAQLAINGSNSGRIEDAYEPDAFRQFKGLPPDFAPPMLKVAYDRAAPDPKHWPVLVAEVKRMGLGFKGFAPADLRAIRTPV
jgi:hypothetical protein